MQQLKLGYNDIKNMPWEYVEWFYDRQCKHLIDKEQEAQRQGQQGKFRF